MIPLKLGVQQAVRIWDEHEKVNLISGESPLNGTTGVIAGIDANDGYLIQLDRREPPFGLATNRDEILTPITPAERTLS